LREAVIEQLRAGNEAGRARIAEALQTEPMAARLAIEAYTILTDRIVTLTVETVIRHLEPPRSEAHVDQLSVLAVGGYGRAEMAPFSDVDLLFLVSPKPV
jgi:[protein-PII] uridylyltransferase